MDWTSPLKAQQLDFCSRLDLGNLLICQDNYFHSEKVIITEDSIEKINKESALESEEIIKKYNLTYSPQKILEKVFYRQLGIEAFLSKFGHITWLDNHVYHLDSVESLINSYFVIKQATNIKILFKIYQGNFNNIDYILSSDEIKNNQVVIFAICPQKFTANVKEYPVIFLGFIPLDLLSKTQQKNNKIIINLSELLYIGGLNFYINHVVINNYSLFELAKKYFKNGNYQQSLSLYNKAIKDKPLSSKSYFLRAICKYKLGHISGALQDLSQTISLNDRNEIAYHWRGYLYQQLENYPEALSNYNQEIKINPLNYFAYFNRAIVYSKLKQLIEALEDYTMVLQINNRFFQGFYNRGNIYYQLGDKQSAIDDYTQAIKIQPNLAEAYYNLGIIYHQLGEYKQALNSYQLAVKSKPKYLKPYYNSAILQADLGYYQESINTYNIILDFDSNFIPAIHNQNALSLLLKKEGKILREEEVLSYSTQNPEVVKIDDNSAENSIDLSDSKQTNRF
ncbi:tetratricopeptide repeat protein [Geminocystis sp. CENA526]|uniref:tetratricopeptide repeat protein n=1 Tax=Geminocystis sp. CENA526 TaxID=1355871 RepID=UPI003D6DAF0E